MDGGIDIFKFDPRWYHRQTFDRLFPEMATVFPPVTYQYQNRYNPPTDSNANDEGNNLDTHTLPPDNGDPTEPSDPLDDDSTDEFPTGTGEEMDPTSQLVPGDQMDPVEMWDDEDKENSTQLMPPVSNIVTYQHIQERSSELARTCQNDQPKMRTILCNLNQMIERVRDGHDIFINFDDGFIETSLKSNAGDTNQPRDAIARAIPNAIGVKRKKSGREYNSRNQKKHRKNVSMSQVSNSNDDSHLAPPNTKSRSCLVCRQKGHGKGRCPLITKYGIKPLEKNNESVRQRLSRNLSSITKFQLDNRPMGDARTIMTELPAMKEIKGLVIHRRFLMNHSLFNPLSPENICLECTILHEQGREHPSFTLQLFNIDCISAFIIRNKTNLIMCQLEDSSQPDHPVLQNQPLSQLTFQNGTGLSQVPMAPSLQNVVDLSQVTIPTSLTENLPEPGYGTNL
jgi:hypothetical protein